MNQLHPVNLDVVCLLSKLNIYDYIIVGSGFGGGPLAEELARRQKNVLLLERGGVIFSTHVLNTSRPFFGRGASNSPEGNESVYDTVKAKVQCTEGSDGYIGGPIYCIGGRSNVWGTWAPEISEETLSKYFPEDVVKYLLQDGGYQKAFDFMTNKSQSNGQYYPQGTDQVTQNELSDVEYALHSALMDENGMGPEFDIMPVAVEFNSSAVYRFPQGAYSTTLAIMNRIFANDRFLTVVMDAEVLSVEQMNSDQGSTGVTSLKVRNTKDKGIRDLDTGDSKVVLCAGTIGTATIVLNSSLGHPKGPDNSSTKVGKGIIDHDIFYARFSQLKQPNNKKPFNMKTLIHIDGRVCLLVVTVNANFFLAGSSASLPPTQYYDEGGTLQPQPTGDKDDYDTIAVLFELVAELDDNNEVLALPGLDPTLRVSRPPLQTSTLTQMEDIVGKIRDKMVYSPKRGRSDAQPPPRLTRMGFGVFAHECGTMRMDSASGDDGKPQADGVVDSHLKVKNCDNLWVCDLSVFPVCPEANPSLTLLALSRRLVDEFIGPENNNKAGGNRDTGK